MHNQSTLAKQRIHCDTLMSTPADQLPADMTRESVNILSIRIAAEMIRHPGYMDWNKS